jgi:hypothetical protein
MPKAFLNHKFEEKQVVKVVNDYLKSCFIETWLDEERLHPGKKLLDEIYAGIEEGGHFIAFLSSRYLKSAWCLRELESALLNDDKMNIIPVLLEDADTIKKNVTDKEWRKVAPLLKPRVYIRLNEYDIPVTAKEIAESIWSDYPVRFKAMRNETIGDIEIEAQLIHYDTVSNVPSDLLKNWDFNIEAFISRSNGEDDKPILNKPVIISGTSINWLITNLTISFYNKRDVLLYNQRDKIIVCAYTTSSNSKLKAGDVFHKTL